MEWGSRSQPKTKEAGRRRPGFRRWFTVACTVVSLVAGASSAVAVDVGGGWTDPLPGSSVTAGFLANNCGHAGYGDYVDGGTGPLYHLGTDMWFAGVEGAAVRSIGPGVVEYSRLNSTFGTGNGVVFISHVAGNGAVFLAVYGHLRNLIPEGATVAAGTQIGTVGPYVHGAHLHFGVRPGATIPATNWGSMGCGAWPSSNGFENPMTWLAANPTHAGQTPAAPSAAVVTDEAVSLAWPGVVGATSYQVFRDGSLIGTSAAPAYTDVSVVPDTVHSYAIATVGPSGVGPPSAASSIATFARGQGGGAWVDFNGDGGADYCRTVGVGNGVNSHVSCTVTAGAGFGATHLSPVLDWGYPDGRAWVDFNGDGRADYCRRVGAGNGVQSHVSCTVSTGTGFGATHLSPVLDWGYRSGRGWVDFNGDGRADYCRRVGAGNGVNSRLACTLSTGTGFGQTVLSEVLDWGYDAGRAWVDVSADGRADYCRVVGAGNGVNSHVSCTLSDGTAFGQTRLSPVIDWGYEAGRTWVDVNADARADYCRQVGAGNGVNSRVACLLTTAGGYGSNLLSDVIDWGYPDGRAWVDSNADGRADYCRRVGVGNGVNSRISCTLSTGTGFGQTTLSDVVDWGYETGRAWRDANADGRADYCRRVGDGNGVNSRISCTLSTGTGFGTTSLSGVLDWGYQDGGWAADQPVRRPTAGGGSGPVGGTGPAGGGTTPGSMPRTSPGAGSGGGGGAVIVRPSDPVVRGPLRIVSLTTKGRRVAFTVRLAARGQMTAQLALPTGKRLSIARVRAAGPRTVTRAWVLPKRYRAGVYTLVLRFAPLEGQARVRSWKIRLR